MSRSRVIETKVQLQLKETIHSRLNETVNNKQKTTESSSQNNNDSEKQQMCELVQKLPKLDEILELHRKIGEGTFSSVYLGSLRAHSALPPAQRRWFAIKHLVPTAHPARVEHELRCLQDIGGKNNVIGVELCLRHLDTIVFVMPYIPHKKFSEYVGEMDAAEVRQYMRALLEALRHVHSFGVIHRDVKPSNFLYDRENRRYLLVDFGLAQRVCPAPPAPPAHNNTLKRPRTQDESPPGAKRMALDLSVGARRPTAAAAGEGAGAGRGEEESCTCARRGVVCPACALRAAPPVRAVVPRCVCSRRAAVCAACSANPAPRAPRAGTQGFRPPEVLLKCLYQTQAVDVWAAGVVLASLLCARYPLLRATTDAHALAELADLVGTDPLAEAAQVLGRRLVTSSWRPGLCLRKLAAWLRGVTSRDMTSRGAAPCPRCHAPQCLCRDPNVSAAAVVAGREVAGFPDAAFSLAARLLQPDWRTRISAAAALKHPFLADSSASTTSTNP